MADIAINPVSRRVQYTGNTGLGPFAFTFNILADADIAVYKNTTLLTLTSEYTVSTNADGTGSITLTGSGNGTALIASDVLTLIGARQLERTTDFVAGGDFFAASINEQLDSQVIMAQQLDEKLSRALKVNPGDEFTDLELPLKANRLGRTLQFNATSGDPEAGPTADEVANAQTYATNAATSATNAATSASSASSSASAASSSATAAASSATAAAASATAAAASETAAETAKTNAENAETNAAASATAAAASETAAATSETNAANSATAAASSASAAATSATNAATSATNAANSASAASASQTAAAASAAAAAASYDTFDDRYLGSKTSDPTLDNDGNALVAGALYFNSTANEMRVYDGANWIAASSAGGASLLNYNYTATAGQTTFSGADDNSATLSYTQQNLIVTLNGIVLEDGTDYTASNGTSIVLASGAAAGDELNVVAFKSFTTADMVPASTGGTFSGNVTVDGVLTVDRATSDGTIIDLQKDGSSVGSVGANAGFITIGKGDTGLLFHDGNDAIWPRNLTTLSGRDGAIDLGGSGDRFRNLYLSGGVYLGGTGAANYLDDYEEGTWTPSIDAETTSPTVTYGDRTGRYTKVGNMVTVWADIQPTISGGSGGATITGLPFAVTSADIRPVGAMEGRSINLTAGYTMFYLFSFANNVKLYFRQGGDNVTETNIDIGNIGPRVGFTFTYMTDA